MTFNHKIAVVIPALNEAPSIRRVLGALPSTALTRTIVVDNGSTDDTAAIAEECGAQVVHEPRRGYGQACLSGIAALEADIDVVVFLDADYADDPARLPEIVAPIVSGDADLVIGSRVLGEAERGALAPQARFGNWLATTLIRLCWGATFTDLGPFRAITRDALERLHMRDRNYGWTVEMQIKAAMLSLRATEVPVPYRRRIGRSKITGTVRGTFLAGAKILGTIWYYWNWGRGRGVEGD